MNAPNDSDSGRAVDGSTARIEKHIATLLRCATINLDSKMHPKGEFTLNRLDDKGKNGTQTATIPPCLPNFVRASSLNKGGGGFRVARFSTPNVTA